MRRLSALLSAVVLAACSGGEGGSNDSGVASSGSVALTGAGATFPYPLYFKWFSDYAAQSGVRINYQSLGSGAGIRQLSEQTVDFGASDAPMSDDELSKAKGGRVLHFPTVLGAVVVTYNADIFLGKIIKWNDPKIAALNPGVSLPNQDVIVVRRSDGSGTTFIFTDYLTAVSPAWAAGPGKGKEVQWPVGLGGKGNEGVAGQVKQMEGSIGYVELTYAKQNRLSTALVQNAAGNFVEPTVETLTAAASGALAQMTGGTDYRVSIVNAPGAQAYPIASLTWLLVYEQQADAAKGQKLVDFMRWMYGEGQNAAAPLDYGPLPAELRQQLTERLSQIRIGSTAP
jgi:phosphate transport system substrate-binding protein